MATEAELLAQLAEIDGAIASPERQVTLGSQNVTLRSIDDLKKARDIIQGQLDGIQAPGLPKRRTSYMVYAGRGYD